MSTHYRALFLSDLHLGSRSSEFDRLILFLENIKADVLYLIGDIVDGKNVPTDAIRALRNVAPNAVYVFGNHDFLGTFGGLVSVDHAFHITARGRRLLVTHGDKFDPLMNGWWIVFHGLQQNILKGFVYRRFVKAARDVALGQGASGIICGHIHHAEIHQVRGFLYANTGDWVSSCTAIAEHENGHFELLYG
jgi:UDP-2,3-diacylglucosamine pyrophosphatase LpxH